MKGKSILCLLLAALIAAVGLVGCECREKQVDPPCELSDRHLWLSFLESTEEFFVGYTMPDTGADRVYYKIWFDGREPFDDCEHAEIGIDDQSIVPCEEMFHSPLNNSDCPISYEIRHPICIHKEILVAAEKPVLYLYPEVKTEVEVRLEFEGKLTCTYPLYRDGWRVTARPDGTLTDQNGREYYCLFWEGTPERPYVVTDEGFVVRGCDTAEFLESKLAYLGLSPREAQEFIVYWLPKMQNNAYNYIRFAGEEYARSAALTIVPRPDSLIRVFMVWSALDAPVKVREQTLVRGVRTGFTAVEWGGCELSE